MTIPTETPTLSDVFLRKLKASGVRCEITDKTCIGLRARISAMGVASFVLKARDAASKLQTVTLGSYPEMGLKAAREEAARIRLDLKKGQDPNAIKRARRQVADVQPTLGALVVEFEAFRSAARSVWSVKGPKSTRNEARRCIERVFEKLLGRDVTTLTEQDFVVALKSYKPVRKVEGKTTSNGQVSRARSYLMPVLHWAAGRKGFIQAGAGRDRRLVVIDLSHVFDPAADDASITGERDRVLMEDELGAVLPFLTYPAPKMPRMRIALEQDFRPIALRFLLFTAARLDEMVVMKWGGIDFANKVWRKPSVKSTKGGKRGQNLPLSDAALDILRSLPAFGKARAIDLVFPNGSGGKLGNWTRFQNALMEATKTKDWHRHDLCRTAATLMQGLKTPLSTIDQILGHTAPLRRENVSGAASSYLRLATIMKNIENPQAAALGTLASAFAIIEAGGIETAA